MNDYGLETEFSMAGVDYKHIHLEEVLLGPDYRRYLQTTQMSLDFYLTGSQEPGFKKRSKN